MSPALVQALADLAQDGGEMISINRKKLDNVPPSPARDEAEQKLDALTQSMGQLVEVSQQLSGNLGLMILMTAGLPPPAQPGDSAPAGSGPGNTTVGGHYTVGGGGTVAGNTSLGGGGTVAGNMQMTLSKVATDRQALVEVLGQASQIHQRSQQEIQKLKMEQLTCDNLEKVAEGIKFVSVMFNFMEGAAGLAENFAVDFAAAFVGDQVKSLSGSALGGFHVRTSGEECFDRRKKERKEVKGESRQCSQPDQ